MNMVILHYRFICLKHIVRYTIKHIVGSSCSCLCIFPCKGLAISGVEVTHDLMMFVKLLGVLEHIRSLFSVYVSIDS